MSDLKPQGVKIKLGDREYGLRFTFNAIDDIQCHFQKPIEALPEIVNDPIHNIANVRYILSVLINEDIDCVCDETGIKASHLDERYVGRHILDQLNVGDAAKGIYTAFVQHTTMPVQEGADPNQKSE